MRNRKMWKRISAVMLCSMLMLSAPAVYAADTQPGVQAEETTDMKEAEGKEEIKGEDTSTENNMEETEPAPTESTEKADDPDNTIKESEEPIVPNGDISEPNSGSVGEIKDSASEPNSENTEEIKDSNKETLQESQTNKYPGALNQYVVYDGTGGATLKFDKGTGEYVIDSLLMIVLYDALGTTIHAASVDGTEAMVDWEKGEIVLKESFFRYSLDSYKKDFTYYIAAYGELKNGREWSLGTGENGGNWRFVYIEDKEGIRPKLIPATYEFDGMQDLMFSFQNTDDMKEIESVEFNVTNIVADETELDYFIISDYDSKNYDIEKGEIILRKHAVSALVYELGYSSVGNTFKGRMTYTAKDGTEKTVYGEWYIKVLDRAEDAAPQYAVNLPKDNPVITNSDMEDLVNKNQTEDIVIIIPENTTKKIVFSFAKGTMKLIDGKENYDFGAEMLTDYKKLGSVPFTEDEFAFQINYNYQGELPGTANIGIPVDGKWIGQTLYYYEVKDNGEYQFFSSGVVSDESTLSVVQNHCSNYVAITRAPDEQGNISSVPTEPTEPTKPADPTEPTDPTDPSGSSTEPTKIIKPSMSANTTNKTSVTNSTSEKASPKTGDDTPVIFYLIALLSACGIGIISVKRKSKIK